VPKKLDRDEAFSAIYEQLVYLREKSGTNVLALLDDTTPEEMRQAITLV
jgi:hypothetical protein